MLDSFRNCVDNPPQSNTQDAPGLEKTGAVWLSCPTTQSSSCNAACVDGKHNLKSQKESPSRQPNSHRKLLNVL